MKGFALYLFAIIFGILFVYIVIYKGLRVGYIEEGSKEYCELFENRPEGAIPENCLNEQP